LAGAARSRHEVGVCKCAISQRIRERASDVRLADQTAFAMELCWPVAASERDVGFGHRLFRSGAKRGRAQYEEIERAMFVAAALEFEIGLGEIGQCPIEF